LKDKRSLKFGLAKEMRFKGKRIKSKRRLLLHSENKISDMKERSEK